MKELIATIYSQKNSSAKLIYQVDLPDDKLDCIVTLSTDWVQSLEAEIDRRYHIVTHFETRAGETVAVVEKAP